MASLHRIKQLNRHLVHSHFEWCEVKIRIDYECCHTMGDAKDRNKIPRFLNYLPLLQNSINNSLAFTKHLGLLWGKGLQVSLV